LYQLDVKIMDKKYDISIKLLYGTAENYSVT